METIIMVKADKSCATKTGHFYLSLTVIGKIMKEDIGAGSLKHLIKIKNISLVVKSLI